MRMPVLLALLTLLVGCASSPYRRGVRLSESGHPAEAVAAFREAIAATPEDPAAWRELGVAYYEDGDLDRADEALRRAAGIRPDARTSLYLGLIMEARNDEDAALDAYREAIRLDPGGRTAKVVRGRLDQLIRMKVEREVRRAVAREDSLQAGDIPENTIAVAGFDSSDLPPELEPLGTGLVEFTSIDLAKVHELRVVERARIEKLLQELSLSSSNLIDPATRARVGLLVGSRNVVTGSMQSLGKDEIEIHGAVGNTVAGTTEFVEPAAGSLEAFFKLQKAFVMDIVETMGIELTPEERDAIAKVPTESYLALMAYCRGLEMRDRGDYRQAAAEFKRAASADRGFSEARVQAETTADVLQATGGTGTPSRQVFESVAATVSRGTLTGDGQQQFLTTMVDNAAFMPAESQDGQGESLPEDPATLPDTGTVGGVNVIVRGDYHGTR